jgi:hypothetical protein
MANIVHIPNSPIHSIPRYLPITMLHAYVRPYSSKEFTQKEYEKKSAKNADVRLKKPVVSGNMYRERLKDRQTDSMFVCVCVLSCKVLSYSHVQDPALLSLLMEFGGSLTR